MTPVAAQNPTPELDQGIPQSRRRIFLVDDHPIVSCGMIRICRAEPAWEVCGTATDWGDALAQIAQLKPDLVVMDLNLQGQRGLELVRTVRQMRPPPLLLVLSAHDEGLYASRVLRAGAVGYVMKDETPATILEAIRKVLQGGIYLSPRLAASGLHSNADPFGRPLVSRLHGLTNRELQVFQLLGQGKGTQEIAGLLALSAKTIGSHRANMMAKLGIVKGNQLVQQAIEFWEEQQQGQNRPHQAAAWRTPVLPSRASCVTPREQLHMTGFTGP